MATDHFKLLGHWNWAVHGSVYSGFRQITNAIIIVPVIHSGSLPVYCFNLQLLSFLLWLMKYLSTSM